MLISRSAGPPWQASAAHTATGEGRARAGSAWSGNRAPRDASRYVSSGRGGRRSRGVRGGWEVEEDEKDEVVGECAEEVADAAFVTGGSKILG